MLKSLEMPKKYKSVKKKLKKKNDLITDSLIEKDQTISMKFKIHIYQRIAKILLKQESLKQIRHSLTGHFKLDIISLIKNSKIYHGLSESKF